jgi:hypothetical protein
MLTVHFYVLQDLEFASVIVQKLNIILITSPELADFRKRLKSLETRVSRHCVTQCSSFSLFYSKTVKLYLRHCTDHGATTRLPSFRYAFLLKLMNMLPICCTSCMSGLAQ